MASSQSIDHEAATREIAKGLELTTRLHSLLRGTTGSSSAKSDGQLQMESLSQEIMQVLVAALSLLMPKSTTVAKPAPPPPPPPPPAVVVVERPINSTSTTTTATTTTTARAAAPVALDIALACPGREEIKISSSSDEVIEISAASEEKQYRKRSLLQSGTMISYEHSSDDHQWKSNHDEKKINKTKQPRNNHQHSSTITTTSPFSDGHQWRKYGEKKICNSRMPRCYYRCTYKDDQGCPATKQVQQTESKDPPTYVVTYNKLHSCKNRTLPISSQLVVVDPPPVDPCHLRL